MGAGLPGGGCRRHDGNDHALPRRRDGDLQADSLAERPAELRVRLTAGGGTQYPTQPCDDRVGPRLPGACLLRRPRPRRRGPPTGNRNVCSIRGSPGPGFIRERDERKGPPGLLQALCSGVDALHLLTGLAALAVGAAHDVRGAVARAEYGYVGRVAPLEWRGLRRLRGAGSPG